jgi:hypothetical protein
MAATAELLVSSLGVCNWCSGALRLCAKKIFAKFIVPLITSGLKVLGIESFFEMLLSNFSRKPFAGSL